MEQRQKAISTTILSILGNLVLAVVKAIAGVFGNSYALIADAIESTTDVFASFLVLIGMRYATKPADENHPYGHGKAEPLITFGIVGFLLISATIIVYKSIDNLRMEQEAPEPFTLIVLILIIVFKEGLYRVVKRRNKDMESSTLHADAWHHRADAITSFAAFIGIAIAIYGGYEQADEWAALIASGIIVYNAYQIFRPALSEIMDEHRHDELVEEIRRVSDTVEGVVDTEKCFVRKTGMTYHVDLHARVNGKISVTEGHIIAHRLKDVLCLEIPSIADILIHIEPDGN